MKIRYGLIASALVLSLALGLIASPPAIASDWYAVDVNFDWYFNRYGGCWDPWLAWCLGPPDMYTTVLFYQGGVLKKTWESNIKDDTYDFNPAWRVYYWFHGDTSPVTIEIGFKDWDGYDSQGFRFFQLADIKSDTNNCSLKVYTFTYTPFSGTLSTTTTGDTDQAYCGDDYDYEVSFTTRTSWCNPFQVVCDQPNP